MVSILGGFIEKTKEQMVDNKIHNIFYTSISLAKDNRDIGNIDELAEDILEDGLETCLLVRSLEGNQYEIIGGHRRYSAMLKLIDEGYTQFEYIPCKVVSLDDGDAKKRLILNNLQIKQLSASEMLKAIDDLKKIYNSKKEKGEQIPGRIRDLIAEDVGLKSSQVGNYQKILNNAIPEVKDLLEQDEISLTAAAELASLNDENQLMFVEENDDLSLKTIKEFKESLENDNCDDSYEEDCDDTYAYDDIDEYAEDEGEEVIEHDPLPTPVPAPIETTDTKFIWDIKDALNIRSRSSRNIKILNATLTDLSEYLSGVEWRDEKRQFDNLYSEFMKLKKKLSIEED